MPDTIQPVEGFESVLKFYTDEQLQAVQERAAVLMRTDPDLNKICSVLIASRQLYALARYALHREMETEGIKWEDGVEEFLIKAMADRATKPFSRTETYKILASTVKKFMTGEINLESEAERTQELITTQRDFDLRSKRVVTGPGWWLQSGEMYIVIGTEEQIAAELDVLCSSDMRNHFVLEEDAERAKPLNLHICSRAVLQDGGELRTAANCKSLGRLAWEGCCNTTAEFTRFMAEVKDEAPFKRVDLLVLENIIGTQTKSTSRLTHASEAVRTIRKVVKSQASSAVLGYPVAAGDVETIAKELKHKYENIEGVFITTVSEIEDQRAKTRSS